MYLGLYVLFIVSLLSSESLARNTKLEEAFSWKLLDYAFPNEEDRTSAIQSKKFIPINNNPLGLDVWRNKLFVTVPRWRDGIVSTLNYINITGGTNYQKSPALIPYPSFEANELQDNCKDACITSVIRVRVDACNRLWVMDYGIANITGNAIVYSKPQILIYNLLNNELIRKFVLNDNLLRKDYFFGNIIVDCQPGKCDEAFAYLPDLGSYAIVVYDFMKKKGWRIQNNFFYPDPIQGNYNVGGQNFQYSDGVSSLALTQANRDGSRTAFFQATSSSTVFKVKTSTLQDENEGKESNYTAYSIVGNKGPNSQGISSFIHEPTGVMFYTQISKNAIYCWNTNKDFNNKNLVNVASDPITMIFPNDLKVDYQGKLWVTTDKLPIYEANKLDAEEVNYRIFVTTVADAIKGTNCDPHEGERPIGFP